MSDQVDKLAQYAMESEPWRIVGAEHEVRCVLCGAWCKAHTHIHDYVLASEPDSVVLGVQAVLSLCAHDHECPNSKEALIALEQAGRAGEVTE